MIVGEDEYLNRDFNQSNVLLKKRNAGLIIRFGVRVSARANCPRRTMI